MMQRWADLLDQPAKGDGKVVPGRVQKASSLAGSAAPPNVITLRTTG
jgi:hypothetical protein